MLLDADSDSVGLELGRGLMSDSLPWVQPQHGPIAPETRMSSYCSFKSAPLHQALLAFAMLLGTLVILGLIPDFLWFFFFFAVNTSVNVWFNKNKYLYLRTYCVCQALRKARWIQSRPGAKVFSWEPSGMYQPLHCWLWQVISLKDFSFTLVLLEQKPFQKFYIHCSLSNPLISPTLLICLSDAQTPPRFVNKKTN